MQVYILRNLKFRVSGVLYMNLGQRAQMMLKTRARHGPVAICQNINTAEKISWKNKGRVSL